MLVPLCLSAALQGAVPPPPDWVIPSGATVTYDTVLGPVRVHSLTVEPGATLRVSGPNPFFVRAESHIRIDGLVDAGGFDAAPVGTLLVPNLPEPGAVGGPAGGWGGVGSAETTQSTAKGGNGLIEYGGPSARGGRGGEAGYSPSPNKQERRGAGGGGGAFGPSETSGAPGLAATPGEPGHPLGLGALSGVSPAMGGAVGGSPFRDGDPTNDFWGEKSVGGTLIVGELVAPRGGSGGGAGGDSIQSATFPSTPFGPPFLDRKGAGGGGGGGLIGMLAPMIAVGSTGEIRANGGNGSTGENVLGFDHIAGSSGGGSGGMIVLEADVIDLSLASADALRAIGGVGGIGMMPADPLSKGGDGGPGLIQLHVEDAGLDVVLPVGVALVDLSAPNAHVLLPEFH